MLCQHTRGASYVQMYVCSTVEQTNDQLIARKWVFTIYLGFVVRPTDVTHGALLSQHSLKPPSAQRYRHTFSNVESSNAESVQTSYPSRLLLLPCLSRRDSKPTSISTLWCCSIFSRCQQIINKAKDQHIFLFERKADGCSPFSLSSPKLLNSN